MSIQSFGLARAILETLQSQGRPMTVAEVVAELRRPGLRDETARQALRRMAIDGRVDKQRAPGRSTRTGPLVTWWVKA